MVMLPQPLLSLEHNLICIFNGWLYNGTFKEFGRPENVYIRILNVQKQQSEIFKFSTYFP